MKSPMQSLLIALALLGCATASQAQDSQAPAPVVPLDTSRFNEGHVWLGQLSLNARSDFWDDNFQSFKASRGRLDGLTFGGDFVHHLDRYNALMLSAGFYLNSINEPSRNLRDESGDPLEHHLDLDTLSLTAAYVLYPLGTDGPVIPYLGAGGGLYLGELNSYRSSFTTDDCDEDNNCTTEYTDSRKSDFLTFGTFALAGLEVPVSAHAALLVDGRYTVAHAHLSGDFAGHRDLDLSGAQVTAGVAVHF